MTDQSHQDDLEALLRRAMLARPLPPAPTDLAARAAQLGRTQEALASRSHIERVARRRKINALITAVATVLVAGVIYLGAARIQSNLSASNSSQFTSTDSSGSSSSSSQQNVVSAAILLTGEGLLVAIILLSATATPGQRCPI